MTLWQYGKLALELTVGFLAIFVLMNTGDRDYFVPQDYFEFAVLTVALLWAVLCDFGLMVTKTEERRARLALAEQAHGELPIQHRQSLSRADVLLTRLFNPLSFNNDHRRREKLKNAVLRR